MCVAHYDKHSVMALQPMPQICFFWLFGEIQSDECFHVIIRWLMIAYIPFRWELSAFAMFSFTHTIQYPEIGAIAEQYFNSTFISRRKLRLR